MTPSRPYLLRALYEWISDNQMTPHILVDAETENVQVPMEYVDQGKIVLNVGGGAVQNLLMDNHTVELDARFGGKPMHIIAPYTGILAIYARENGKGMVFTEDDGQGDDPPPNEPFPSKGSSTGSRPKLRVIK